MWGGGDNDELGLELDKLLFFVFVAVIIEITNDEVEERCIWTLSIICLQIIETEIIIVRVLNESTKVSYNVKLLRLELKDLSLGIIVEVVP